ncbi:MAG TPA: hypothetical protein VG711_09830 [Phycisphaerales bacterium]|nr:hypothetical protein [Phycisphaerales bacterium]
MRTALRNLAILLLMTTGISGCANQQQIEPSPGKLASKSAAKSNQSAANDSSAQTSLAITTDDHSFKRDHWVFEMSSEQWIEGDLITTRHYQIFSTIRDDQILARLPQFYEAAMRNYTTAITDLPTPTQPLITYLFQYRNEWLAKTRQVVPEQADMFATLGRGGFTTRSTAILYYIDWNRSTRDTFAIAAHEGWHQYTQRVFKDPLPVWLEEGIATYMEGYRLSAGEITFDPAANRERREELRRAVRENRLLGLQDVLTGLPQSYLSNGKNKLLVYYAQVWALTRFLMEGEKGKYRSGLQDLLQDAVAGTLSDHLSRSGMNKSAADRRSTTHWSTRIGPAVAAEYFNSDLAAMENEYRTFVDTLVQNQ